LQHTPVAWTYLRNEIVEPVLTFESAQDLCFQEFLN
jgi:hypothetical protein